MEHGTVNRRFISLDFIYVEGGFCDFAFNYFAVPEAQAPLL